MLYPGNKKFSRISTNCFDFSDAVVYNNKVRWFYKGIVMTKEAIVIGLGLSGCVAARLLADAGYSVSCFEKESHIGGNLFEEIRPNGQRVQLYGPHIFHTDNEDVYTFLKRFGNFYPYTHRVLADVSGKVVPVPVNFTSLSKLFNTRQASILTEKLTSVFGVDKRISPDELLSSGDNTLIGLGKYLVENLQIPNINRVSEESQIACDDSYMYDTFVETGDNDNYYPDKYQAMPILGFLPLLENMLSHPKISYQTNTDGFARLSLVEETGSFLFDGIPFKGPVIFTPSLDILFDYRFGHLPFRISNITHEDIDQDYYLDSAVLTNAHDASCVRIFENKYLTLIDTPGTTSICKESSYSKVINKQFEPFEPAINKESLRIYGKYARLAGKFHSLILLGRLACYKNMSISDCIEQAMKELPVK